MGPYFQAGAAVAMLCFATLAVTTADSASSSSPGSQSGTAEDEETQLALDEVGKLFRRLFPLVPDKAQYFWKSSHLGGTLMLRNHEQRARPAAELDSQEPETDIRLGTSPWRVEVQFRKRGPDCMRKCIAQGILHPVQCHSLC